MKTILLGYAQFETHDDRQKAIARNCQDGIQVDTIPTFPSVPSESAKEACDMHFAEAQAINRPRSMASRSGQKVVEKEFMYPVKFFMG